MSGRPFGTVLGTALAMALVVAGVLALAARAGAEGRLAAARTDPDGEQVASGAAVYAFACASCHGPTGRGFEEAVAAFPTSHRDCASCHQPQNAARMPGSEVGLATMAFSLGDPPPLADARRLAAFGTVGGLYRYVSSAMPRWAPGSLSDEDYLAVSAHLLRSAGMLSSGVALRFESLDEHVLHAPEHGR